MTGKDCDKTWLKRGMVMKIAAVALTNRGNVRENNEDNLFFNGRYLQENPLNMTEPLFMKEKTDAPVLLAVFDGVGGAYYGEKASCLSAETMAKFFEEKNGLLNSEKFFRGLCHQMNREVCELEDVYLANIGSTVSALLFKQETVTICNLGDSPVFRIRKNKIERIHEEHTNRRLLEEQKIERKPELTQCLGIMEEDMTICPYIREYEMQDGDWYLLCSDGLTDMLTDKEIAAILRSRVTKRQRIKKLMEEALMRGGRDNITIILVNAEE